MKKAVLVLALILFADYVLACPGCAGSMGNPNDSRLVWILGGFVILIYIPFYILYRTIIKNRHLNNDSFDNLQKIEVDSPDGK